LRRRGGRTIRGDFGSGLFRLSRGPRPSSPVFPCATARDDSDAAPRCMRQPRPLAMSILNIVTRSAADWIVYAGRRAIIAGGKRRRRLSHGQMPTYRAPLSLSKLQGLRPRTRSAAPRSASCVLQRGGARASFLSERQREFGNRVGVARAGVSEDSLPSPPLTQTPPPPHPSLPLPAASSRPSSDAQQKAKSDSDVATCFIESARCSIKAGDSK
jgi:hypothetical protein